MSLRPSRREFLAWSAAVVWTGRTPAHDLLVRGGSVIDGTGRKAFRADVAIDGDRIAAIGDLTGAEARRAIDATGLTVTPGFIDVHAHTDLLRNPGAQSKIFQGVTLDVTGPDGGSPFPARFAGEGPVERASQCSSFDQWADRHDGIAMHLGSYVGHSTIRNLVVGPVAREPDSRELSVMQDLVRAAMEEGALGLSSGLEYNPAGFAKTSELIALAEVAAEFDRPYATHMRNEDDRLLEAADEAIRICRESGAPLLITHMKVGGKPNWHKIDALLERVEAARAAGLDVSCDRYPYEAWSTSLDINFPGWSKAGGRFRERLSDPEQRARMREETLHNVEANGGWGVLMVSGGVRGEDRQMIGRRIDEIAREAGVDPFELACDLLARGSVSIIGFGMSEENTERIVALPYCMIASDGGAQEASDRPGGHPRSFGTFPRAIRRYVRERRIVSLEEMVRKMTSLPADTLRIEDRGRLAVGKVADIAVFDAGEITDTATYLNSRKYAEGVRYLLVNGRPVVDGGRETEARPGQIFRAGG